MILFFLKKSFFDGWDNLFRLVLVNLPFTALVGAEASLSWVILSSRGGVPLSIVEFLMLAAGFVVISIYSGASAWFVNKMADFEKAGFGDFFAGLKKTAARSALFGLLVSALYGLFFLCLKYYGSRGDILGNLAMGMVFWCGLFCLVSLQHFYAIMVRLDGNIFKLIKKCFLIAIDNMGFSIFMGIWSLVMGALSIVSAGFIPGPAGIQLGFCDAMRLRVYKYDWLEKNPGAKRNAVPWKELIAEDEDSLGVRTLRGMIFPWKDEQR